MAVPTAIRRASLEKDDVQADAIVESGKADMDGASLSDEYAHLLHRGSGGSMYTREAHATRETRRRSIWVRVYIAETRPVRATVRGRAIPCSDCAQQRHDIIPNRVALAGEESVSGVTGATEPGQSDD